LHESERGVDLSDGGVHAQLLGSALDGLDVERRKVRWPSNVGSDESEVLAREVINETGHGFLLVIALSPELYATTLSGPLQTSLGLAVH
jgi:hypothetical protein